MVKEKIDGMRKVIGVVVLIFLVGVGGLSVDANGPASPDTDKTGLASKKESGKAQSAIKETTDSTKVAGNSFAIVMIDDTQTVFPGGDAALEEWLSENINYPEEAAKEGIEGKVYVAIIVEKDGTISEARIERRTHPALDAEALRVVSLMPKWNPNKFGTQERITYLLPITFKLD